MKIYCISDSLETALGFKLCGVESNVASEKDKVDKMIDDVLENPEIGVLVVTQNIYNISEEKLDNIKLYKRIPLIVKI